MILASLQASEWLPGEAIPSEIELATRDAVSQGTVRKAIDELAAENLLVRRQGKGTFVATHQEDDWLSMLWFSAMKLCERPSALTGLPSVLRNLWILRFSSSSYLGWLC